jgi:hypothetical protein
MLFFGAFIMRYRIELIATVPLISWVMAVYFNLSFNKDSAAQNYAIGVCKANAGG